MGYSAKVGSFNIDTAKTAGQSQAITGVGFQPKIVLFFWGGSTGTGDTVGGGTVNIGFGAGISSSSRFCVVGVSEDGQAVSDAYCSQDNTECIRCYTNTATIDGIADFASLDADGFTLTIDNQFAQAYRISYLALGGTDLTDVYIGNAAFSTGSGEYTISGVGFQPDALLISGIPSTSASGVVDNVSLGLGMATAAANQGVVFGYSQDAQAASNTTGYGYNGEVHTPRGTTARHAFVAFTADGFTLNNLQGTLAYYFYFIALKGSQYAVGELTTRTDGNDIVEDVGFQPAAILFASANRAVSTQDVPTDHMALSLGAATSAANRACAAVWDEDALETTETARANYDSAVYANVKDDAVQGLMDLKSIDPSGFTCVMDDADPSACWVTYLVFGEAAAAGNPWYAYAQQ